MSSINVGFIGLGNMGMPTARSLVKRGLPVTVYDIRKEAVEEIVALGANSAGSCREVAGVSDVVISLVRDIPQTEEVIFGKDGVLEGAKEGITIIISSTISPSYCKEVYARVKEQGVRIIDCAVSARDPEFENRPNTLMIGGDEEVVKRCWPVFEAMGKNVFYLGGIGSGQAYKLVNQLMAGINRITRAGVIECLNVGLKAGLDIQKMIEVMSTSTGARSLQNVGLKGSLNIQEIVEVIKGRPLPSNGDLMAKDKRLAMELAEAVGAKTPISQLIDELDTKLAYDAFSALIEQ